jgi:two-component system phosphate regulon sensor histidine kinase PhoR
MSPRLGIALLFGAALLLILLGIYSWGAWAGATVFAAAALGALAARLFRSSATKDHTQTKPAPESATGGAEKAAAFGSDATGELPAGALLEATMESMREGVLVLDKSLRVIASNASARALFRQGPPRTGVTLRLSDLTRNPAIHAAFAAALERGERTEVKVQAHAGERSVFDLHVAPLRSASLRGSADGVGAIGVFFDVTRLERLERVRQEFLSNVSHELRTPLTAILTFIETLEETALEDTENSLRFLSIIRRNAERMHNLLNDILELSAIEAGQVTVTPALLRLAPLVAECFTALAGRAAERGVKLVNEVPDGVLVYADERRLEQMLMNLTDNAIKFNTEGGSVRATHERVSDRDRIHVSDTGEGIAPEHLSRIFERFYRIDRARSRALGGTGLGLAIVKHLARAHDGEATVRSELGCGATFTIELPAREEL